MLFSIVEIDNAFIVYICCFFMDTSLDKILKKTERFDEISDMAKFICHVLGYNRMGINEHSQDYTEFSDYRTRYFDISYNTDMYGPEIKHKGKLVFRVSKKRHYYRSGSWEESFERLYSRAVYKKERKVA